MLVLVPVVVLVRVVVVVVGMHMYVRTYTMHTALMHLAGGIDPSC